jgi:glycine cleavage system protein P-like pyridoxal-binding family
MTAMHARVRAEGVWPKHRYHALDVASDVGLWAARPTNYFPWIVMKVMIEPRESESKQTLSSLRCERKLQRKRRAAELRTSAYATTVGA